MSLPRPYTLSAHFFIVTFLAASPTIGHAGAPQVSEALCRKSIESAIQKIYKEDNNSYFETLPSVEEARKSYPALATKIENSGIKAVFQRIQSNKNFQKAFADYKKNVQSSSNDESYNSLKWPLLEPLRQELKPDYRCTISPNYCAGASDLTNNFLSPGTTGFDADDDVDACLRPFDKDGFRISYDNEPGNWKNPEAAGSVVIYISIGSKAQAALDLSKPFPNHAELVANLNRMLDEREAERKSWLAEAVEERLPKLIPMLCSKYLPLLKPVQPFKPDTEFLGALEKWRDENNYFISLTGIDAKLQETCDQIRTYRELLGKSQALPMECQQAPETEAPTISNLHDKTVTTPAALPLNSKEPTGGGINAK